ncbi:MULTISPECIES: arabinan endo-1,5-alpha-L-arabinosidase [Asticcacaulis]|uniref:arabinan endo-1,5-alpha-L-arabinosidase n=1 Tax=Asticcacaulis TaxID=76890 RepID=UPI001AE9D479|nr:MULTISPECIES: arabinan endo-1,5-alpha-L-arabinosidase [Asticcacaulis]MBP2161630.1 arabinan endo-1,5-alpha-L-arabinosidase [Asticcacaulis solisilvae]MDR6802675.1 arabinan endo-1,5-alpha-L-arabinosidase [Asticcacaulis sp. BE141]
MITKRQLVGGLATALVAGGAGLSGRALGQPIDLTGDISPVHDPCIIQDKGTYHLFCTSQLREGKGLIHWRTSPDLVTWTLKGAVMPVIPQWAEAAVPGVKGIWAPDVAWFNGRFHIYYSCSTFGSNQSAIGLVTSPTLDTSDPAFGWTDQGKVIGSVKTDIYNAIDANHVEDADGRHWLSFGSFWSGLKIIELDPATGKLKKKNALPRSIAGRKDPGAIEAPVIIRKGEYYYLFASFDFCCRGANSTYYTVVGRSKSVEGPYLDRDGGKMKDGGGTIVLHADQDATRRWKGPGHVDILQEGDVEHIVYHAYDSQNGGRPTLRIQKLSWQDGWPVAV